MFGFGKPSKSKFNQIVIEAARKAGVTGDLKFDEAEFTLIHGTSRLNLTNLYDQYCACDKEKKPIVIENAVGIFLQTDKEFSRDDALEQVVAVIRERATFAFLDLETGNEAGGIKVPSEPIGEWFIRALVLDAPGSMRYVTEKDLKEWDLSFEEMLDAGMARLRAGCSPNFQQQGRYFSGAWNDDYDSSRAFFPEVFDDLPISGKPVVCLPNRLTLLVAGSDDVEGVGAMLKKAEELVQSAPRPQNPAPLTYREGELVDLQVSPESELFQAIQRAQGLTRIMLYDEQKELLERIHQKTGKDIHVAQFTLTQNDEGNYCSYCVWSKGVMSLLPKTNLVMLHDPDKPEAEQTIPVKWDDIVAAVGDLMLDAEMFPPRFYVSKFPTAEQFARMPQLPI
jgi:hypothetical protein